MIMFQDRWVRVLSDVMNPVLTLDFVYLFTLIVHRCKSRGLEDCGAGLARVMEVELPMSSIEILYT